MRNRIESQTWRPGKVLVLLAVSLPALFGVLGLVLDSGMMMSEQANLQHATDAAAEAAAMDLLEGKTAATAQATAATYLQTLNGLSSAQLTINIPPSSGFYAGQTGYVEVIATLQYSTLIMQIVGAASQSTVKSRSVAGYQSSTTNSALVILDPSPPPIQVTSTSLSLPSYPALVSGLGIQGAGNVVVSAAVLVNTTWGGVDQNGNPVGTASAPPWGIACTDALPLTQLQATNIRVVGGVDDQQNYASNVSGQPSPLRANALPVSDPLLSLATPSTATDPVNVSANYYGFVQVMSLPLVSTPTVLNPGVYDWIEIDSGAAVFNSGVYIIRNVSPTTGVALNILGGTVTANGVLFYITNTTSFNATTGTPDSGDGDTQPPAPGSSAMVPSVVINGLLPGSVISPLPGSSSPFGGLIIYQRRQDYRPIVVSLQNLIGSVTFQGVVYAKWGHFLLASDGNVNLSVVSGSARFVPVLGINVTPYQLLPPAQDVYLVE